jgi:glycine betaine/proline transport system substrate-binding protein
MTIRTTLLTTAVTFALAGSAFAEGCDKITMADVGWTDNMAQNGIATVILEALGYEAESVLLSLPITYSSVADGQVDIFLDQWLPTMESNITPYRKTGEVVELKVNMEGAKFTLATNEAGAALGIKDFADIAAHKDALDGKIFGVEAGNDGNTLILQAMSEGNFGLSDFELVESSEQGMLAQVERTTSSGDPVVFLAWEPHPMNAKFKLTYLTGGDAYFGANFGGATVYTLTRKGFVEECPNTGKFFSNLDFSLALQNEMMGLILDDGADPRDAAKKWLAANPTAWGPWLDGVTTKDGGDAKAAVAAALK